MGGIVNAVSYANKVAQIAQKSCCFLRHQRPFRLNRTHRPRTLFEHYCISAELVGSALPYIHSIDIIDRDVRAESILVSMEGDIKFICVNLVTQLTKKMPVCKTRADEIGVTCSMVVFIGAGSGLDCAGDSSQVYCRA